ncbi:MAG: phosphoenolpyruvate--protein phosphotransferase [Candidatus Zixiibacteriota bacterium]
MKSENFKIKCVPVSGGLAIGEVQVVRDPTLQVVRRAIPQQKIKSEIIRLETALNKTVSELEMARNKAVLAIGEQGANVFDAQVMIASDKKFQESVIDAIRDGRVNAEYAFQEILAETLSALQKSRDPYLRQMINDIKSVSERVLSLLLGVGASIQNDFKKPTILVGRIFSPGQIMSYSKKKVVGFLTEEGGPTSHMGLIVRSLGIPAVMTEISIADSLTTGMKMIIDGNIGEVIINPDSEILDNYHRIRTRKQSQPFAVLGRAKTINPLTRDGHRYGIAANLEIPGPLDKHLIRLGIGVGLYRTEFLYFNDQSFPSEEEQFQNYFQIADKFRPLPVTLRTFDLGGDKYAEGMENLHEENPALGWRGIRVSLDSIQQLKTQIRAILRASVCGNIRILLPMVSDAPEIIATRDLIKTVKNELKRSRIPYDDNIRIGAMIEVPSAAMQADYLAELVDFFSIGTNDLVQYTMAADRANHRVAKYYIPYHPSVLKLIQMTVLAAHDNGIPVAVCGEMAGDKNLTPFFVGLGVDELSMNPALIPGIADWISRLDYLQSKRFVSRLMRLTTVKKISRALREAYEYTRQQKKGGWLQ